MSSEQVSTVAGLGESGVLRRILASLGAADSARIGPGDDCAVLGFRGDAVVTTDTMIEGPDFRLSWHRGTELGWKLAATNLSDVAAMGARPTALTVALACPAEIPVELLEEIARGLDSACRELAPGCGVVGGDLGRAPVVTVAVTALGELDGRPPVTRAGARPGDVVAYAGELGLAGLGLSLLFAPGSDPVSLRASHPVAIAAQLAPRPPIRLGVAASLAGATAMLDVSDGLALDASRIAQASRIARVSDVALEFSRELLSRGFGEQSGVDVPLDAMLFGGEDHGLLATFPESAELPDGFHRIGVVRSSGEAPVLVDGEPCEPRGWDPFTA